MSKPARRKRKPKQAKEEFAEPAWLKPQVEDPERRRFSREIRTVFFALASVVLLSAISAILLRQIWWVDTFAAGLATETTGILITVVFVHRLIQRQERSRRLRGSIGALRRGSRALHAMAESWARLITGSLDRPPAETPRSLLDLFAPHLAENVAYADPRRRQVGDADDKAWVRILIDRIVASRDALNQIIVSYSASLDPAYVEAIDAIVDDDFLGLVQALANQEPSPREWRVRMNAARAARETHLFRLSDAIRLHNQLAREATTVRSRRIGPRTGSFGMELPLDHDLRVELELGRRWWNGVPVTSELRAETLEPSGLSG